MKKLALFVVLIFIITASVTPLFDASAQTRRPTRPTPFVPPSQPTTGISLTVSPVFLNLTTDPGKSVNTSIRVQNNNNETEYLRLELARFVPVADGNPVIADVEKGDAFAQWISFSPEEFVLAPNESRNIRVTIDPSDDAALGYYYAIVVDRIQEARDEERPVVAGSPAIPVLLEVRSPNAAREIQIVDFKTDKAIYEYLPTEFEVKLKNTGNIHASPLGDIFIDAGDQKDIAIIPVNNAKGNVLPQTTRSFTAIWDDGFAVRVPKMQDGVAVKDKDGKPVYETKYDFTKADKFRIGKYTANLLLIYDNGERDIPLEAKVSFWIIPWKILLIAGGVLLFALLGIFSTIKSMRRGRR
jgi:hypothetical protein